MYLDDFRIKSISRANASCSHCRNRTPLPTPTTNPGPNFSSAAPGTAATTDSIGDATSANRSRRAGSGVRSINAAQVETKPNGIFNDPVLGGEASSGIRYRAPSQEVTHIGTIPKRTESLYLKLTETTDSKGIVSTYCQSRLSKVWMTLKQK